MMLLWWSALLLCLSANAENNAMWRESGKNVNLKCSSAGCSSSIEGYDGMHLYLYQDQKEPVNVLYYHSYPKSTDKVSPGVRFTDRIQTSGSLKNQIITISNLTVEDSGFYRCVYIRVPREVTCNVYTLFIRVAACSRSVEVPHQDLSNEKNLPLVLIITVCAVSVMVTVIFTLLIILRVKQWISNRRRTRNVPQVSSDVYEDMTNYSRRPAPEQLSSTPSPYNFA